LHNLKDDSFMYELRCVSERKFKISLIQEFKKVYLKK